jgi:hypothetical protein
MHLVKAQDFQPILEQELPIITLMDDPTEQKFFSAEAVKRKVGDQKWRELSAKYTSYIVDAEQVLEDFDPISNF